MNKNKKKTENNGTICTEYSTFLSNSDGRERRPFKGKVAD